MDSEFNSSPDLHLPTPVATEALPTLAPEQAPAAGREGAPQPQGASPQAPPPPPAPLPMPMYQASNAAIDDTSSTASAATPAIADDNDLIEKEWVNKAKQIVEKTREDPHRQSQEITAFKAGYMQKRYNKVIKLSE